MLTPRNTVIQFHHTEIQTTALFDEIWRYGLSPSPTRRKKGCHKKSGNVSLLMFNSQIRTKSVEKSQGVPLSCAPIPHFSATRGRTLSGNNGPAKTTTVCPDSGFVCVSHRHNQVERRSTSKRVSWFAFGNRNRPFPIEEPGQPRGFHRINNNGGRINVTNPDGRKSFSTHGAGVVCTTQPTCKPRLLASFSNTLFRGNRDLRQNIGRHGQLFRIVGFDSLHAICQTCQFGIGFARTRGRFHREVSFHGGACLTGVVSIGKTTPSTITHPHHFSNATQFVRQPLVKS